MAVHRGGDNVLAGSKDGKVAWFQLDISTEPYKIMDYHGDKIKDVGFHTQYPLVTSCSRNGKLLLYHASINDDLMHEPVIVPLKVLKATNTTNHSKYII